MSRAFDDYPFFFTAVQVKNSSAKGGQFCPGLGATAQSTEWRWWREIKLGFRILHILRLSSGLFFCLLLSLITTTHWDQAVGERLFSGGTGDTGEPAFEQAVR